MEDAISIVSVHDSFEEVLDGGDDRDVCGEEKGTIRKHCTETTHDEEEKLDDWQENSPIDELIEDNSESSVQNGSMLEQKIADAIDIPHLHIWAGKQIALLVASWNTHGDVGFEAGEFVGLRGHDRHDVALFALNAELPDGSSQITLLVRGHCRANHEGAKTA